MNLPKFVAIKVSTSLCSVPLYCYKVMYLYMAVVLHTSDWAVSSVSSQIFI